MQADYAPVGALPERTPYIFSVHPLASPQDMLRDYATVVNHLAQVTGERFVFETSRDYGDYEQKLRARRYHFSLPNPAQTLVALDYGYRIIAKTVPDDYFRGVIIGSAQSPVKRPDQLRKQRICFPSATALAATLMPLAFLQKQGVAAADVQAVYVGNHTSVMELVARGEFLACGTSIRLFDTWQRKNPERASLVRVLWTTPPLPGNGVIARDDVPPAIADAVANALAASTTAPNENLTVFTPEQFKFERATASTYAPLRRFLQDYDKTIGLPPGLAELSAHRPQEIRAAPPVPQLPR